MEDVMKKTRLVAFSIAFLLALFAGSTSLIADQCDYYYNSRPTYISGHNVCAYTGGGCTECYNSGGGSCVTNGSSCRPRPDVQY